MSKEIQFEFAFMREANLLKNTVPFPKSTLDFVLVKKG